MKEITPDELAIKMRNGEKLHIIDVREDEEVATGKIPGARHIRLGDLEDRLDELDKNEHYYMVCRSGGRSSMACEILLEKGFSVTNMVGGMLSWDDELEF
ncbi:rhodanese-like domain-containing protein [Ornithinibacillus bavariensis]|uniref:Rhodanese-like domain-containing protein n=1 Tax=Ornithinibacillus bavariensis TaxID=545502 RepID=A0A919XD56_9BACI|nr:rhodanese-like domain-containing protein [Ornithinibacillus bavariensis]GIO28702.1 rhodanese-like domain-containing protein [Ornithinibacillus bavariensis]